jgi:hypothetical protein
MRGASPEVSLIEVDDICAFDPLPPSPVNVARSPVAHANDTVEIELTAEQMDALLSGE